MKINKYLRKGGIQGEILTEFCIKMRRVYARKGWDCRNIMDSKNVERERRLQVRGLQEIV